MDTKTAVPQVVPQVVTQDSWEVMSDTEMVMDIGEANGLDFWIAGYDRMLTSPVECQNGWTLTPKDQSEIIIPVDAFQGVELIEQANIPIHGFVIGHEPKPVPKILEEPEPVVAPAIEPRVVEVRKIDWGFVLKGTGMVLLGIVGAVFATVTALVVLAIILTGIGAVVLVMGLAAAAYVAVGDPALLVLVDVDEDGVGTYIGVYAWDEPLTGL